MWAVLTHKFIYIFIVYSSVASAWKIHIFAAIRRFVRRWIIDLINILMISLAEQCVNWESNSGDFPCLNHLNIPTQRFLSMIAMRMSKTLHYWFDWNCVFASVTYIIHCWWLSCMDLSWKQCSLINSILRKLYVCSIHSIQSCFETYQMRRMFFIPWKCNHLQRVKLNPIDLQWKWSGKCSIN